MKRWSKVLSLLLVAGLVYAVGTDSWVDVDEFLQIPKAAAPPVIDGTLDEIWYGCPIIKCDTYTSQDPDQPEGRDPDDYLDLTTEARAMWDGDAFYIFIKNIDDEANVTSPNSWENDSFEIYFDGDNSKNVGNGTYDANDKQWRWVKDEPRGNPDSGNSVFAWVDTDYGYNLELKIPAGDLPFAIAAGHEFGFEIQGNDRDKDARQHLSRWWHTSNYSWTNPSLFGNAILNPTEVDGILPTYKATTPFNIDGEVDDAWLAFPKYPQNTWVTDADNFDFETLDSYWYDCYMTFRVAWDENYFYAFVEQWDDLNSNTSANPWQNDSVELYWDGDNSKNDPARGYDANDKQFRWVSDGVTGNFGNTTAAVVVHDDGFNLEVAVPWSALNFAPKEGELFGFEVQTNDNDSPDGTRSNMGRWWHWSNDSWRNPSIFGTAVFMGTLPTAVKRGHAAKVESFDLAQNYPNPFNPSTTIKYAVRAKDHVRLTVYDMLGHRVATLVDEVKNIGTYAVTFDASSLPSGNYFYKLETGNKVITKKMTLVK